MDAVLLEAHRLAANDDPLAARALLNGAVGDKADALRAHLDRMLAHAVSRDAYAAFYAEQAPERPFTPLEHVPKAHELHPRWAVVRHDLLRRKRRRVLELGCHDGWTILNLAMQGVECVGVDLAPHAVAEANRRAARWSVPCRVYQGFLEDVALPAMFDAVLLLEILEHVVDVDAALAAAERCLTPDGIVYITCPLDAPAHTGERERREHVRLLGRDALVGILTAPPRVLLGYHQWPADDARHGTKWHHYGAYAIRR